MKTNLSILTEKTKGLFRKKTDTIDEKIVQALASQLTAVIVVTGTIGKTSTLDVMKHILTQHRFQVISNQDFSMNRQGISQALLHHSDFRGRLTGKIGIFEVEKESLRDVLQHLTPHVVVVTNFYERDFSHWFDALDPLLTQEKTLLLANAEEPFTNMLQEMKKEIKTFSVQGNVSFVDYQAMDVLVDETVRFTLNEYPVQMESKSVHVAYNAVAAIACLSMISDVHRVPDERLCAAVSHQHLPANGRMEFYQIQDQPLTISVWNNSIGAEMVINAIEKDPANKQLFFFFSDRNPDLWDTSWIWEVEVERIDFNTVSRVICSGRKAHDIALRLKYAGVENEKIIIEEHYSQALTYIQQESDATYLLPSYTYLQNVVDYVKQLS